MALIGAAHRPMARRRFAYDVFRGFDGFALLKTCQRRLEGSRARLGEVAAEVRLHFWPLMRWRSWPVEPISPASSGPLECVIHRHDDALGSSAAPGMGSGASQFICQFPYHRRPTSCRSPAIAERDYSCRRAAAELAPGDFRHAMRF